MRPDHAVGRWFPLLFMVILLAGATPPVAAEEDAYREDGHIGEAPYRLRVPRHWNGTVLVYAPGYRDKAEGGEPGRDILPPPVPIAPDLTITGDGGMEDDLIAQGYGLAGTRYRDDGLLLDGVEDTVNLVRHVREVVLREPAVRAAGHLRRLVLVGCSLGAVHVARIVETQPSLVDGGVTLALPGAGIVGTADYLLAFQLAYDVTFGWPPSWGEVGDVRNADGLQGDLDWEEETLPHVAAQSADLRNRGRFEFIRLVVGLPLDGFHPGSAADPGNIPWLYAALFFATEVAAEAETRLKGRPYRNVNHRYSLSPADRNHLRSVDPTLDVDRLLARMNQRSNYQPDGRVRTQLQNAFGISGALARPLIAVHNTADGVIPVWQASVYADMVKQAGHEAQLVQAFVRRPSHCAFTVPQVTAALAAMDRWVDTGNRPSAAAFPASAGFARDFSPPRWPFGR